MMIAQPLFTSIPTEKCYDLNHVKPSASAVYNDVSFNSAIRVMLCISTMTCRFLSIWFLFVSVKLLLTSVR